MHIKPLELCLANGNIQLIFIIIIVTFYVCSMVIVFIVDDVVVPPLILWDHFKGLVCKISPSLLKSHRALAQFWP